MKQGEQAWIMRVLYLPLRAMSVALANAYVAALTPFLAPSLAEVARIEAHTKPGSSWMHWTREASSWTSRLPPSCRRL